jgi:hypothetical protein
LPLGITFEAVRATQAEVFRDRAMRILLGGPSRSSAIKGLSERK